METEIIYSIGEVSEQTGISTHTIRYYEKEGLLPDLERNGNGIRVFYQKDIDLIEYILCFRNTGMSIADIKHIVALTFEGDHTIPERIEILKNHKAKIESQMSELNGYLKKITYKLNYYGKVIG